MYYKLLLAACIPQFSIRLFLVFYLVLQNVFNHQYKMCQKMSLYDINCLALNFLIICSFILILEHLFSSSGCLEYRKLSDKCYLTFFNLHIIKSVERNRFNLSSCTSLNKMFSMSSNSVEKTPFSIRHSLSIFYKRVFFCKSIPLKVLGFSCHL